jgi:hypothetical protein
MAWGWGWGCGCGDSEAGVKVGVGSDIFGRIEDEMGPELVGCVAEFGAPAPSLADEVRLPEFACSSGCVAVWDFWAMVGREKCQMPERDLIPPLVSGTWQ